MKRPSPTLQPFVPGLLILVVLGLYTLGRAPLNASETAWLARASAPTSELTHTLYSPLYLLLLHGWSSLGQSLFWLRLLGVLAGLGALPLSQLAIRRLGGQHATLGALLLLGASPFLLGQVHQVSPAPMALVAALACFLCFVEFTRQGNPYWLASGIVATLVAWGIHPGLFYILAIQAVAMVVYRRRYTRGPIYWWGAQVLLVGLFLAGFGGSMQHYLATRLPASGPGLAHLEEAASGLARLAINRPLPAGLAGGILFGLLAATGLWVCRDWRRDPRHGLLVLAFALPFLIWLSPPGHASYGLIALPFLLTLVSMGLRHLPLWGRQLTWAGVVLVYLWGYWELYGWGRSLLSPSIMQL